MSKSLNLWMMEKSVPGMKNKLEKHAFSFSFCKLNAIIKVILISLDSKCWMCNILQVCFKYAGLEVFSKYDSRDLETFFKHA